MRVQFCPRTVETMNPRPNRDELRQRLVSLRKAVVAGSIVAFLTALGLVATNPVGTQASTQSPPTDDQGQPADQGSEPGGGYGYSNPISNAPQYQPPVLHSRRS